MIDRSSGERDWPTCFSDLKRQTRDSISSSVVNNLMPVLVKTMKRQTLDGSFSAASTPDFAIEEVQSQAFAKIHKIRARSTYPL